MASAEVSEDEASLALTNAEKDLVLAYQAVLEAEQAGANVSSLVPKLNEAGEYLARAQVEYRIGHFENATNFAGSSRSIGDEVQNAAAGLKTSAFFERVQHMWFMMIGSLAGMILVFLGSFWVWRAFKRRYYRRVLGMKPEVVSGEP